MFDQLTASATPSRRSTTQAAGSVALHAVLVVAAVHATAGTLARHPVRIIDTSLIYVPTPHPGRPPRDPVTPPDVALGTRTVDPVVSSVVPLDIVPTDLPPIDLGRRDFDPREFSGHGQASGGSADGAPGSATDSVGPGVFLTTEVDDPAQLIDVPAPRYPPALARAGVEGRVELAYVIGAVGRVEASSISVLSATNEAFVQPAVVAVRQARFRPGLRDGEPVRQLVQQAILFRLKSAGGTP